MSNPHAHDEDWVSSLIKLCFYAVGAVVIGAGALAYLAHQGSTERSERLERERIAKEHVRLGDQGPDESGQTLDATAAATPTKLTPGSNAFLVDVKYSQQRAVRAHPALAIAGSPLNRAFLARMNAWKAKGDPRMQRSDWPEHLADDCAANP